MSNMRYAVRAENLGKAYHLGARRRQRELLGAAVVRCARSPLRTLFERQKGETLWALKDVSFEIEQGDSVAFVGSNGAGKSTLLKVLSRITEPTCGRAEIRGRLGTLLEVGSGFHPELTGRENVYLSGSILGMSRQTINSRFEQILDYSGMEHMIDTAVKFYSSGQYMRLGFAVAIHLDQELLLIDETLTVGDPSFQAKCCTTMQELAKEGRTLLFVSHMLEPLRLLSKNAIWLDRGNIVQWGKAESVLNSYQAFMKSNIDATI